MKRLWMVGILACLLFGAGCSELQTRGGMTAVVAEKAALYQGVVTDIDAGALPVEEARLAIVAESELLDQYYDSATVNVFDFWFGKKLIYASPAFYGNLKACALDFSEAAKRAALLSDHNVLIVARRGAQNIVNVDLARKRVKP